MNQTWYTLHCSGRIYAHTNVRRSYRLNNFFVLSFYVCKGERKHNKYFSLGTINNKLKFIFLIVLVNQQLSCADALYERGTNMTKHILYCLDFQFIYLLCVFRLCIIYVYTSCVCLLFALCVTWGQYLSEMYELFNESKAAKLTSLYAYMRWIITCRGDIGTRC